VLWRKPVRQIEAYLYGAFVSFITLLELTYHGPLLQLIPFDIGFIGFYVWVTSATRIIVTDQELLLRTFRGPLRSVNRADVSTIHVYLNTILLADSRHKGILRAPNYWTKGQLAQLADTLGASVYDHRKRWRTGNLKKGRLIQSPPPR
jgi:hypothetical protein